MRFLGLDVGSVRIGVSLSDPTATFAQPHEVIIRRRTEPVARIAELVMDYEVHRIVVGRPLRLSGEDGPAVQAIESFVGALQEKIVTPVEWWDERLTTPAAERIMIEDGVRRQRRRANIDKVAAALILQSYLDARRP